MSSKGAAHEHFSGGRSHASFMQNASRTTAARIPHKSRPISIIVGTAASAGHVCSFKGGCGQCPSHKGGKKENGRFALSLSLPLLLRGMEGKHK